jgi:hypothetical protein
MPHRRIVSKSNAEASRVWRPIDNKLDTSASDMTYDLNLFVFEFNGGPEVSA